MAKTNGEKPQKINKVRKYADRVAKAGAYASLFVLAINGLSTMLSSLDRMQNRTVTLIAVLALIYILSVKGE